MRDELYGFDRRRLWPSGYSTGGRPERRIGGTPPSLLSTKQITAFTA